MSPLFVGLLYLHYHKHAGFETAPFGQPAVLRVDGNCLQRSKTLLRDFYPVHAFEGKQEFNQVFGGIGRGLFHDGSYGIGHRSVKSYLTHHHSRQICSYTLPGLKHRTPQIGQESGCSRPPVKGSDNYNWVILALEQKLRSFQGSPLPFLAGRNAFDVWAKLASTISANRGFICIPP